jgi:selenocysteine lyase/cysteine desulfurase
LAATVAFRDDTLDLVGGLVGKWGGIDAQDEDFWAQIQQAFALDRNIVNLNNGGCSPSPRVVQDIFRRQIEQSNQAPSYFMWRQLEPEVEDVRRRLAKFFGCQAEELAITRNASESLETCLLGLDLQAGDEIVTTVLDYPRMITSIQQRERRNGVKMLQIQVPAVPNSSEDLVRPFREAMTDRTKLMLCSHVSFVNGQIFPVRQIVELGRSRGVPVIVDGAHAFAQFPFSKDQLGCEFYGTSLHKWLMTPVGAGFLYVKKERIPEVWSLMASSKEQTGDIRKFEEIGTHPAANHNAIGEALTFNEMIGIERKAARFRYLRSRWTTVLQSLSNVHFHTSLKPEHSCAITTVSIDGMKPEDLAGWLLTKHAIFVTSINYGPVSGIRVTPNVYTTVGEIDRFAAAMIEAATKGIS